MKQGKNNEIDLLLRSLARAQRGESALDPDGPFARENQDLTDHLDADELSSFAEGVVPAPARTRFIAHLADCENCRGVVVGLTQASRAAAGSETREPQSGAGFWSKMASLFSPPVLRYAVPAIALSAVIAISFFALRQNRGDLVAVNAPTKLDSPASVAQQQAGSPLAQSKKEAPAQTRGAIEPRLSLKDSSEGKAPQDDKPASAKSSTEASDADTARLSFQKSASPSKSYVEGIDRRVFATEPQATPAAPPKPAVNEADKVGEKEEVEVAKREVQGLPAQSVQVEKNQPRDEAGRQHGPSRNNNAIPGNQRADGIVRDSVESRAKSKKDSEDESETRTVSGRRFRRQGNAWIDTAYESSRRIINVARDSEQFRALVADEPAIRTIAEKLSGVVIVVSNGKAYRIY
jgi:hypothetical protein